jgi:hypothetical protein
MKEALFKAARPTLLNWIDDVISRDTSVKRSSRSCGRSMFWISQGQNMVDAIRQIGVSEVTYYRWR